MPGLLPPDPATVRALLRAALVGDEADRPRRCGRDLPTASAMRAVPALT